MHMVSEKDLNSAELESMWTSTSPTAVTVMLLQRNSSSSFAREALRGSWYTYHWSSGQKTHLTNKWQKN